MIGSVSSQAVGGTERLALLHRYGEAIVRVENARGKTQDGKFRGELQKLLVQLMTIRTKVEMMPAARLVALSTLGDLEAMENAMEAAISAESDTVRAACLETASNALTQISRQLS